MNDLAAADGKYYRNCLTDFDCRSKHMVNISLMSPEIVLAWLCQELKHAAEQADILDQVDVWARYCDISDSAQIDITSSFQTRRNTFKKKLADRLKGIYEIIVLHDQPRTQPRTILFHSKFRHIPVSEIVNDEANDTERLIPSFKYYDQDAFLSMVHVAKCYRKEEWRLDRYHQDIIGNKQMRIAIQPEKCHKFSDSNHVGTHTR